MSFTQEYGGSPYKFAGHKIEARFETLPGEAQGVIKDQIRKDNHGYAQVVALRAALRLLKIDDKVVLKNEGFGSQRVSNARQNVQFIPSIMDGETMESLVDRLLADMVRHEFWLAKKKPYDEAFEEYLSEEEVADPTPLHAAE